jgi:vanillate O-demethylase monooxygenase subunit
VTVPPESVLTRAQQARSLLADRHTPFILDAWYVAAFPDEIGAALLARTLLGKPVVMFRDPSGEATALDDRCAHRSYPLSAGRFENGAVVCGYHGFRYDVRGDCVQVPATERCPANIGVRRYPLVERGGLVWIWLGDAAKADAELIPALPWTMDPSWVFIHRRLDLPCNYVSLHENLLDLTHIEFLHANTLGRGGGYAAAPFETDIRDGYYALTRRIGPSRLPPIWARTTGLGEVPTAARVTSSEYLSPGCQQVSATYFDSSLPAETRPQFTARTAHLPTPQDANSTHYFILHGWNFGQDDPELGAVMRDGIFAAFHEDVQGLSLVQKTLEAFDADEGFYEQSVGSDTAAVAMRRWLKTLAVSA